MAEITKVWIEDDECISCEACVDACPEVFEMADDKAVIKAEAQDPEFLKQHSDKIAEAAEACPVSAIKFE
jgi:ferredoxin